MISERDLMGTAVKQIFGLKQRSKSALLKSVSVKDVMKKRVITVEPDVKITEAAHLMADRKIGCMPVVSAGTLVGLITSTVYLSVLEKVSYIDSRQRIYI